MSLNNEGFDVLQAHDKAGRKSSDDPIMRVLKNTLLNGKGKYDGSKDKAIMWYSPKSHAPEHAWRACPQPTPRHGTDGSPQCGLRFWLRKSPRSRKRTYGPAFFCAA